MRETEKRVPKLRIILFVLLLFAPSVVLAQGGDTARAQVRLRGSGRNLIVISGRVRRTLNVRELVYAARLDEVKLLLLSRKGSFVYLLVDACGPSKLVPDARQCGAADECALLWIKLDSSWRLSEIQSARYESCWHSSSSSDGYKISGRKLQMEYDDFSDKKHYRLSYDADEPERGLQVQGSPLT